MFKLLAKYAFKAAIAAALAAAAAWAKKATEKPEPPKPPSTEVVLEEHEVPLPPPPIDPLPSARKAFDVSNFMFDDNVSDSFMEMTMGLFKNDGFAGVMIGVWRGALGIAEQQAKAANNVGLWFDTYSYMYFDEEDHDRLLSISQIDNAGRGLLWIDCEYREGDMATISQADVIQMIHERVNWVWEMGFMPAIYTQRSWWHQFTGNYQGFKDYSLWDANELSFVPYGGWTKPTWTQYAWDLVEHGANVDLSIEGALS